MKITLISPKTPIIWGGIHPTIRPDECFEYADMVCVGDGEDALKPFFRCFYLFLKGSYQWLNKLYMPHILAARHC